LVVNKEQYHLLDLTRGRYECRGLRETAIALARRYKPDVLLVKEASVELKKILPRPVKPISVDRDKVGRLYVHKAKFEAGLVLLPKGAPFCLSLKQSC
jgi:phage terminase large subunit-like protein